LYMKRAVGTMLVEAPQLSNRPRRSPFKGDRSMTRTLAPTLRIVILAALAMTCRAEAAKPESHRPGLVVVEQATAGAGPDRAAGNARVPVIESDRYGSLATGMPYDDEIRLGPNSKRVSVWRLQTIRFVTADGSLFTWRFDGLPALDEFPLAVITPAGIAVPAGATVCVNGEIPISP
jgi:hypothetical protein